MKDKVYRTTHDFTKKTGMILCNHGAQEAEAVGLLLDHGYKVEVEPFRSGGVSIKYRKNEEEK